jgi:hypothetical protein
MGLTGSNFPTNLQFPTSTLGHFPHLWHANNKSEFQAQHTPTTTSRRRVLRLFRRFAKFKSRQKGAFLAGIIHNAGQTLISRAEPYVYIYIDQRTRKLWAQKKKCVYIRTYNTRGGGARGGQSLVDFGEAPPPPPCSHKELYARI